MSVARGHGIADAEELELALRIARRQSEASPATNWSCEISPRLVESGFQLEIKLIERDCAMVDDDLVDRALLCDTAVVAADMGNELIAVLFDRLKPDRSR